MTRRSILPKNLTRLDNYNDNLKMPDIQDNKFEKPQQPRSQKIKDNNLLPGIKQSKNYS